MSRASSRHQTGGASATTIRYAMLFASLLAAVDCPAQNWPAQDWPQWRGPAGVNHAAANATAPIKWDEQSGLAWTTELPGRGNSSPTIVGDRIYLTTGDETARTQSLLILDRATGVLLKQVVTHTGALPKDILPKNSHANATVASDGQRVFAMFLNDEAPILTAYDMEGDQLWQQRIPGDTRINFEYGFGSSPIIVDGLVIVATEFNLAGSGIYAFDAATGERAWHTPRTKQFSYSTPAVAVVAGEKLLLMCGNNSFAAYEASTGKEVWNREGTTMATCGTMAWDQTLGLGFACGGHPEKFVSAINLAGEHDVIWEHPVKCYEQSVLTVKGYVYAVSDVGVAYCWRGSDGEEMWRQRLRGNFSSSPIVVGNHIYVTNESGTTFVLEANHEECVQLAKNRLGDHAYATPAPVDGRLYHRFGKQGKEYLAAIGPKNETEKAASKTTKEVSILVVTGGHDYDKLEFRQLFESMAETQCEFVLTEQMQSMKSSAIADKYDALVMMDMVREKVADEAKQQFSDLSRAGVGMVFLHFTLASRPYWDEYHEMIGGKFYLPNVEANSQLHSTYSTDMTVKARVLNPAHPVTKTMKDFSITDAFYGNVAISPTTTPLLASCNHKTSASIAWTHTFRSSRIVYVMPGFTKQAYQNDGYKALVRNAIQFVAD